MREKKTVLNQNKFGSGLPNNNLYDIRAKFLLGIFIVLYIIFFSYLSIRRHRTLNSGYYDLAIMDQTVYNTTKGRFLELTDPEGEINFKRMAIHNDIVLALLAPFYLIYSGPETLLVIQTVVLALGAIPLFLLAKKILKSKAAALILTFSYLLYPALQNANLFDFHAVTLATGFLLFMIYFAEEKKYCLSFLFLFLSIFAKEQVALTTAMFGLYFFMIKKEKKLGLAFFLISIFWFVISIWYIIPYFRKEPHFALFRYKELGETPTEIVRNFLLNPHLFFIRLFSQESIKYLFDLLIPVAFLPLLAPVNLLIILPELAINLFSSHWQMRTIDLHYTAVITPFIFSASVYGAKKIKKGIFVVIIASLVTGLLKGSLLKTFASRPETASVRVWKKALINENIKIAASEKIAPHFSQRKVLYRFSERYKKADFVVLLTSDIYHDWLDKNESIKAYKMLVNDNNFKLRYKDKELEVYEQVKDLKPNSS